MGIVMPMVSTSWKASLPINPVATCPAIAKTGDESMYAVAIPVIRFVAPGPEVPIHTPTFPEARAKPSAACAAHCSCLTSICLRSESYSTSYNGSRTPPGYPKTVSTP